MNRFLPPVQRPPTTPPPVHVDGQVLYLDFDGVLHPEDVWRRPGSGPYVATPAGHKLFEHASLLVALLAPYPDVRIVLSTNWVRVLGSVRKVAHRLPEPLRARVVGATFHGDMDADLYANMPRGMQVWADVRRRHPAAWLALDDQNDGWPDAALDHLVLTDPVLGISEPGVYRTMQAKLAALVAPGDAAVLSRIPIESGNSQI
ncbi:HAD domain-containing protein [Paraburkholderia sp. A1RO-5]|uniref:HAD domain-containing protein n=1 Tax=Paraburkholderia sp. A1RO-5 TaxID=3028369 RepID=UPI003B7D5DDC